MPPGGIGAILDRSPALAAARKSPNTQSAEGRRRVSHRAEQESVEGAAVQASLLHPTDVKGYSMTTGDRMRTSGIHHMTAICGDPQRNVDFYVGLLGLRLVKKTVNFDDAGTYHLYYGDGLGTPGTIMTFFAWILPPAVRADGQQGNGQVTATALQVPAGSIDFWIDRLAAADIDFQGPEERFGERVLALVDPDGLPLELVGRGSEAPKAAWVDSTVPAEHSIQGFAGATFSLDGYERSTDLLTATMGFTPGAQEGPRFRFHAGDGDAAITIDLLCRPEGGKGRMGIGAVHHIAWRATSGEEQLEWRRVLGEAGQDVTPVLDRTYFTSVYFREPGGVLYEIATDEPGFTVDESVESLGSELKLPPWLEARRERLEAKLPRLRVPARGSEVRL